MVLVTKFTRCILEKVILWGYWRFKNWMIRTTCRCGWMPVQRAKLRFVIKSMELMHPHIRHFANEGIPCTSLAQIFADRCSYSTKPIYSTRVYLDIDTLLARTLSTTLVRNMITSASVLTNWRMWSRGKTDVYMQGPWIWPPVWVSYYNIVHSTDSF